MIGNSATFIVLVLVSFILSLMLRPKNRIAFLAMVSVFYGISLNHWAFGFFFIVIVFNFLFKRFGNNSKLSLISLTAFNLFLWVCLKIESGSLSSPFSIMLPIGFSIFIFQQITFLWAPKELINDNKFRFFDYVLYSLFFGNITTGPLLDFNDYAKQMKGSLTFSTHGFYLGLIIFMLGFFKKIVFADSFGSVTVLLFEPNTTFQGNLLIPFLLNKYEIYVNFLAYSEMAIGIGLIFGIQLSPNFNRPFATTSIIEFWKRWHMTLIAWIRNYVFYPLVVSRLGRLGSWFLILMTFVAMGMWHDFTINHFAYGLIQFFLVFLENQLTRYKEQKDYRWRHKLIIGFKWMWFYGVLISIPALIFRSKGFGNVMSVLENIFSKKLSTAPDVFNHASITFFVLVLMILLNELMETKLNVNALALKIQKSTYSTKLLLFFFYLLIIFYFGMWTNAGNFIYSTF